MNTSEIEISILELENKYACYKWIVHNGYLGWAYGSPVNPLYITKQTVIKLITRIIEIKKENPLNEMNEPLFDYVYAEINEFLWSKTGKNRILGFHHPKDNIFEEQKLKTEIFDFEI